MHDPLGSYGSIERNNSQEHDLEELANVNKDCADHAVNNHASKQRLAFSAFSTVFLMLVLSSIIFYCSSNRSTSNLLNDSMPITNTPTTQANSIITSMPTPLTNVDTKEVAHSFQVPFPHIDRAEYGTNPVPASSIVDPSLFEVSLLGSQGTKSSLLKVPFPTGAFWTNLVIKPTADRLLSYPIMSYPYAYKWNPEMVQVSFPALRRLMDHLSVRDIFNPDLTLSTVEDVTTRHITYFDPLSVTLRFKSQLGLWETYLVQGSPYVTVRYKEMTPVIQPISIFEGVSCIQTEENKSGGICKNLNPDQNASPPPKYIKLKGTQFIIKTRENLSWMLFMSNPVTLVFDNIRKTTLYTEKKFTGILRLALIPPPLETKLEYTSQFPQFYDSFLAEGETVTSSSGVQTLIDHATIFPTGAAVSWNFPSDNVGNVQFRYKTNSMTTKKEGTELLMLALPHHVDVLSSSLSSSGCSFLIDHDDFDLVYRTIKGHMAPVLGSTWSFDEALTSTGFDSDTALKNAENLDEQTRAVILDQVAADVTRVLPTLDENVYGYGKQVARLAQLVHIAHVFHHTSSNTTEVDPSSYSNLLENSMKTLHSLVTAFLSGRNIDILVYDTNFGGLVTRDGLNDFMNDFGNGWYNDHHFHYGYHLYACALLGQWNSTFVSEYGQKVDALLFDVVHHSHTSSDDPSTGDAAFFPLARHKSWFDGHSFASGLFPFASGKSMESSSESINCYYGAYLWSSVRGKKYNRKEIDQLNFSKLLLAMEVRAVKTYWHMSPQNTGDANKDERLYNPTFAKNLMVGNLGMMDVTVSTWFGSNPLYVHMINFMPITGITHEVFDTTYLKHEFHDVIKPIYDNVEMAWKGYVVCDRAMLDPNAAWNDALKLRSFELDQAISKSQVLYFASTRDGFEVSESNNGGEQQGHDDQQNTVSISAYCLDNQGCAELGLTGLCCPTPDGTNLGCCKSTVPKNTEGAKTTSASCSAHKECARLRLEGLCCPTSGGANLSCCN